MGAAFEDMQDLQHLSKVTLYNKGKSDRRKRRFSLGRGLSDLSKIDDLNTGIRLDFIKELAVGALSLRVRANHPGVDLLIGGDQRIELFLELRGVLNVRSVTFAFAGLIHQFRIRGRNIVATNVNRPE